MPNPIPSTLFLLAVATQLLAQDAVSTFGHARARELAALGRLPSARDIVVRDLVNYHRHRLPLPRAGQHVALDLRFDRAGASAGDDVWLQVGYTTAPQGDRALSPPCAVALVVDVSGSMAEEGKMTAVQAGLRAFAERLRADDQIALVTFSTKASTIEPLRRRGDGRWLLDAIERLRPEGNTNLHAGLMLGIAELAGSDAGATDRRVVVLTDGIANKGVIAPDQIVDDATRRAGTAIDISTIGVGQDLDVPLLKRLADGCRGLFHFVADATDVQKVFVAEADALLAAVARNVRLTIELPGSDLQVVQALHENVRRDGDRLVLDLPDLNAGATGVVMVRCKLAGPGGGDFEVRAEMAFTSALANTVRSEHARATLAPVRLRESGTPDHEVRKNAAIAVLAQGLADMAQSCDARRWADADRALQRATDDARRLFPGNDDDVQRVRDITEGHSRTLRRYVDRFRDH